LPAARRSRAAGLVRPLVRLWRLWWLTTDGAGDIVTASGALAQWIFVSPRHQLVVSTGDNIDGRATAAVEFLFSRVLPSAREGSILPGAMAGIVRRGFRRDVGADKI